MRNPHAIDAELRRRGFGSLGAIRYQGPDDIDVALDIPADFATVPYHLVPDDSTGLPSWVEDTGGGASALADLTDVNLAGLADKYLLVYDSGASEWIVRPLISADLPDDGVTNAKLANMATGTMKGRKTAGTGDPEDLSASDARTNMGLGTVATLDSDTDATLAANSNTKVATQAAIKGYVDSLLAGRAWKNYVRAATTAAGTLASSFENGDTIDGVVLATGDRILIKNQATGAENGIYVVAASGAPTRATDADSSAELVNAAVFVSEGTTNADTQWVCTTNSPITVGSTTITFVQFGSGTTYAADGSTLQLVGTTFSIKAGGVGTTELAALGVTTAKLADAAVTFAKMQDLSASRLMGRGSASGTGPPVEITLGSGLSLSGTALSASGAGGGSSIASLALAWFLG